MFHGLWDHTFDLVYKTVTPKNEVVDVHKKGRELMPPPPSVVGSKAAAKARRNMPEKQTVYVNESKNVRNLEDIPPNERPCFSADGTFDAQEEHDFIPPEGQLQFRQRRSRRPGEHNMHNDFGPTPVPRPGASAQQQSQYQSYSEQLRQQHLSQMPSTPSNRRRWHSQTNPAPPERRQIATHVGSSSEEAFRSQRSQNSRDPYGRPASAGRVDRYRPQSYGGSYNDYDSYDEEYDDRRSSRRDRKSSKSKSRKSRSRSGFRGQLDKRFDKSEKGLTTGALGALAGGLVGHEVGKGALATVAGVVLGGLGANAFEARNERGNENRDKQAYGARRSKSVSDRRSRYDDDDYYRSSRRGGGRGRDYDDDYDSYEEDESPRRIEDRDRERSSKRKSKRREEEASDNEKHFNWNNILKS